MLDPHEGLVSWKAPTIFVFEDERRSISGSEVVGWFERSSPVAWARHSGDELWVRWRRGSLQWKSTLRWRFHSKHEISARKRVMIEPHTGGLLECLWLLRPKSSYRSLQIWLVWSGCAILTSNSPHNASPDLSTTTTREMH